MTSFSTSGNDHGLVPSDQALIIAMGEKQTVCMRRTHSSPVFEPLEADNGRLMEPVFERIYDADGPSKSGAYPPPPEELWEAEVKFEFETPLSAAYARIEFEQAVEVSQYMAARAQINPGVVDLVDHDAMDRSAIKAIAPQAWIRNEDDVERERNDREEQAVQRERADARQEDGLVPVAPLRPHQHTPGEEPRREGDAEVDAHALRDVEVIAPRHNSQVFIEDEL